MLSEAGGRVIYQEFKEIFEENKQGFEGKSRTLTQFITFEEYTCMAYKADNVKSPNQVEGD